MRFFSSGYSSGLEVPLPHRCRQVKTLIIYYDRILYVALRSIEPGTVNSLLDTDYVKEIISSCVLKMLA